MLIGTTKDVLKLYICPYLKFYHKQIKINYWTPMLKSEAIMQSLVMPPEGGSFRQMTSTRSMREGKMHSNTEEEQYKKNDTTHKRMCCVIFLVLPQYFHAFFLLSCSLLVSVAWSSHPRVAWRVAVAFWVWHNIIVITCVPCHYSCPC